MRAIRVYLQYVVSLGVESRRNDTLTPSLDGHVTHGRRDPSYANLNTFRIEGRPVLVLYLSRTLTGDVSGMITRRGLCWRSMASIHS